MSKRWLKDFLRYVNKVFLPEGWTKRAKDHRKNPEIAPGAIWVTLLIGFALQVQSLEELERRAKVCFKKLLPRKQRRIDLTGRIGLRVHEFATAINVAPRTVYAWIDHGELEAEKHGRIYIIPAKVVKKFTGGDNIN